MPQTPDAADTVPAGMMAEPPSYDSQYPPTVVGSQSTQGLVVAAPAPAATGYPAGYSMAQAATVAVSVEGAPIAAGASPYAVAAAAAADAGVVETKARIKC